jgi:hypothetical protein
VSGVFCCVPDGWLILEDILPVAYARDWLSTGSNYLGKQLVGQWMQLWLWPATITCDASREDGLPV